MRRHIFSSLRLALLLLFLLAVSGGLVSCHAPGAVRPSVKIGLVAPFEGRYRYIGYDVIYAARLAIREANAHGGIGGYSIELIAYDDGARSDLAFDCADKLAVDAEVVAVVGHFWGEAEAELAQAYAEAGIPLVAPGPYVANRPSRPNTAFHLAPSASDLATAVVERTMESGAHSLALVSSGSPFADEVEAAVAQHGLQLVYVGHPRSEELASGVVLAAPDGVVVDAVPTIAGEAVAAMRGGGWSGQVFGATDLTPADYAAVAGNEARASCVTPWPLPEESAGADGFVAGYLEVSNGVRPGRLALPAYEAVWLLVEAIRADLRLNGQPSRAGVSAALPEVSRTGLLGRIEFGEDRVWSHVPLYACEVYPPDPD